MLNIRNIYLIFEGMAISSLRTYKNQSHSEVGKVNETELLVRVATDKIIVRLLGLLVNTKITPRESLMK